RRCPTSRLNTALMCNKPWSGSAVCRTLPWHPAVNALLLAQLIFRGNGVLATKARRIRDFMKPRLSRMCHVRALAVLLLVALAAPAALAARVGIMSNKYATETAADFNARIQGHTFTGVDTASALP